MACGAPNPALGTAQRYAEWFDCNARTIGQDGFLGLANYITGTSILPGLLTIFVAMIGYRLLLGGKLDLSDGVGWAAKVGIVLALLAGWSAFQAVFYQLVVAGPGELSSRILAASGIPTDETVIRAQRVYDALRLGLAGSYVDEETGRSIASYPSLPVTAVIFLLATVGAVGGAKLLAGFLLAVAPVPIALLLFGPGMGLFVGWLRALATTIFTIVGLSISSLLCLLALESEVSRMQTLTLGRPGLMDDQAPLAVAALFLLLAIAIIFISSKVAAGLAERLWESDAFLCLELQTTGEREQQFSSTSQPNSSAVMRQEESTAPWTGEGRTLRLASAFERTDKIAQNVPAFAFGGSAQDGLGDDSSARTATRKRGRGSAGHRALGRRHRSALKRDRTK